MRIGIDFGGVLVKHDSSNENHDAKEDTNFDVNKVPWMEGALETLASLAATKKHQLFIVSFCGKKRELETREALKAKVAPFIPESNWIFVRDRKLKSKACKDNQIDVMIDDRLDILLNLLQDKACPWLIWFNPSAHPVKQKAAKQIIQCDTWSDVAQSLKNLSSR